jgi:hypothetical protein
MSNELIFESDRICVTSDYHIPHVNAAAIQTMLQYCRQNKIHDLAIVGDFLDLECFGVWPRRKPPEHWTTERDIAKQYVNTFEKQFNHIYACCGNHEARLLHQTQGELSLQDVYNMLMVNPKKWYITPEDYMILNRHIFGVIPWRFCHPRNYSQIPLRVARSLASKYLSNIVNTHGHFSCGPAKDVSGKFLVVDIGGLFNPKLIDYVLRTTTYPMLTPGWAVIEGEKVTVKFA